MPTALPTYLGNDFSDCPPGHRFGLYFDGWTDSFGLPKEGKTEAFRKVTTLPAHSLQALKALRDRQRDHAEKLGKTIFIHPARLTAPLATGLGNEHPLENGFAFLNPHGLPYLAGSGVKGVLRRAAEELASGEWGDKAGWDQTAIDLLFGPGEENPERDSHARCGALMFWDLFFQPPANKNVLTVEIMTPHHAGYLQGSGTPHANEQPNPIPFLAVPPGCECTLYVQCNPALIPAEAAALRENWKTLLAAAIEHASEWLGFGAKTAVGYGRIDLDVRAANKLHEEADARQRAEAERIRAEKDAERIATLAPWQQTRESVLRDKPADVKAEDALLKALEAGRWPDADEARTIATEIVEQLKATRQWREKSEKKNPDKDHSFQKTLRVKRFLA